MEVETVPPQPAAVESALVRILEEPAATPDPWWQAGIDEALEPRE